MATVKVVPGSLTEAYKKRQGDFAPNLVGLQFTEGVASLGTSLFTFGNFEITSNFDNKLNKNFVLGGEWSDYYSLDNLKVTQNQSEILLSNDIFVKLNFDPYNISRYVYFGSFYEYARVSVEQIIQKWKGSVYLNPTKNSNVPSNTVLSFSYDSGNNISEFLIPKSIITNNFELIVDSNTDFNDIPAGSIYNLSRSYYNYVIWNVENNTQSTVIGYTGSTESYNYIRVRTIGNPFPSISGTTFGQIEYHLKPNNVEVQLFFEKLTDFENILLNRLTTPIYTSEFTVPQESDGIFYDTTKTFTWPVSDGYNIDINTNDYTTYVENLLAATIEFDQYKTNLVSRRFVSESIHEYDTNGGGDPLYGMKVTKLLKIYGREFDEVKKYIDGISFANVVTYNKLDNTSDELIKIIAANLGFDALLTVTTDNFNLLQITQPSFVTPFSGYSRSLSAKELDVELWRRIVVNAWWLFKSKGTRKVIEFFLNLFKIPECVVSLNEYIYLAENRLNIDAVYDNLNKFYDLVGGTLDTTSLPMDDYGFPRVQPESIGNYFQMNGFWYNGGTEITTGNNPHIGPYDYGKSYFDQYRCFIENFDQFITASTTVTVDENYFDNYNKGTFVFDQNGLPVPYYGAGYAEVLNQGLVQNAYVESAGLIYQGGTFTTTPTYPVPGGENYSMKIRFTPGSVGGVCAPPQTCPITYNGVNPDYVVYSDQLFTTPVNDSTCCPYYWLPVQNTPPPPPSGPCPGQALTNSDFTQITPWSSDSSFNTLNGWTFGNIGNATPLQGGTNLYTTDGSLLPTTVTNPNPYPYYNTTSSSVVLSNSAPTVVENSLLILGIPSNVSTGAGMDFNYIAQNSLTPGQTYNVNFRVYNDNSVCLENGQYVPCTTPTEVYVFAGTQLYGPYTFNDPTITTEHSVNVQVTPTGNGWFVILAKNPSLTMKTFVGAVCVDAVTNSGTGNNNTLSNQDFACYWCVPTRGDTTVCDTTVYGNLYPTFYNGNTLTETQILNANDLFNDLNNVSCNIGNGIILDNVQGSFKTLNEDCCLANGGTWQPTPYAQLVFGTTGVCISPATQTCTSTNTTYDPANNVVVSTLDNSIISQECCTALGYNWATGDITVIDNPNYTYPDTVALSFTGLKPGYCTPCPTSIKFIQSTSIPLVSKSQKYIQPVTVVDSLTNSNLSQNCCTSYGFNYDTLTSVCYKCPAAYNVSSNYPYSLTEAGTTNSLSQSCCPGWYGTYGTNPTGCYQCSLDPNSYTIQSGEVLYAGQSLSSTCCDVYKNNIADAGTAPLIVWNSSTNKCLKSVGTGPNPGPAFSIPMTLLNVDPNTTTIIQGTQQSNYPITVNTHNSWLTGPFASTNITIPTSSNSTQHVLRINVRTQGSGNPIKVRSLGLNITPPTSGVVNSSNTNLSSDIVSNDIRIYYTGNNGTEYNVSTINGGALTHTGGILASPKELQEGDNFFWITMTIKPTATSGDYLFAQINGVGILINPYQYPADYRFFGPNFFTGVQGGSSQLV